MTISVPKTKAQHIRKRPRVTETTEDDITNLPPEKKFKFLCKDCDMTYPSKHGLAVHQGRWCKKSKTARKPSRKGTVADRIITQLKVEKEQETFDKVKMGSSYLENVYSFIYLGAEIAGDGDQEVTLKHRVDIAYGRFAEYREVLTTTKLPVQLRVRIYKLLVVTTMVYGSSAWLFTENIKKKLNGVNSKFLHAITKRTIHDEAREPTFDVVKHVLLRRRSYLGHILRLDEDRALRRYLLDLSPPTVPFMPGSLHADTEFETLEEAVTAASDKVEWRQYSLNSVKIG